jgi:hypothetical protein
MPRFYIKYTLNQNSRVECMSRFAMMSPEDDLADMGEEVDMIGRWATVGESSGFCVAEATTTKALHKWLSNWAPMATMEVFPVVDDNQAREIILGSTPSFVVDYSNVNSEAKDGESLYFIEYTFFPGKITEGYTTFANMKKEDDENDAGSNTCYGRWHNMGTGSGIAICSSKSEYDLHKWAYNWSSMCNCKITPVVSDNHCRENLNSKAWCAVPKKSGWWR